MGRRTASLLLAGCLVSFACAQSQRPSSPSSATQTIAAEQSPAATTSSNEAPWDKFTNFSALMTGGPVPGTADEIHIYRSGDKLRMEGPERRSYIIQDLNDDHNVRAISRIQCLQMGAPFIRSFPFFMSYPGNKYEHRSLGKDTLDGHPVQIEEVTITFAPSRKHAPVKLKLWEADDLQGFPIKLETQAHRTIGYRNVDFGPLDPTLFIVPDSCPSLGGGKSTSKAPKKAPSEKAH